MSGKGRVPMQVSPNFKKKLKDIQRKMIASGRDISLRELTEEIATTDTLNSIEEKINLKRVNDVKIKLDRRGKR